MSTDTGQTDTTPVALPFIGGVVPAVPCRVPQNIIGTSVCTRMYSECFCAMLRLRSLLRFLLLTRGLAWMPAPLLGLAKMTPASLAGLAKMTPTPLVGLASRPRGLRHTPPHADLPQVADDDDEVDDEPPFCIQGLFEWDSPVDLAGRIALTAGFLAPAIIVASWIHNSDIEQQTQREMIMQVLRDDVNTRLQGGIHTDPSSEAADAAWVALPEAPAQLDTLARQIASNAAPDQATDQATPAPHRVFPLEEDAMLDVEEARALLAEYRKPWRESLASFGISDILPPKGGDASKP